jgi:hypothetical protein
MYSLYFFTIFFRSFLVTTFTHDKFFAVNLEVLYKVLEMIIGFESDGNDLVLEYIKMSMRITFSFVGTFLSIVTIRLLKLPKVLWFKCKYDGDDIWFRNANYIDPFEHYGLSGNNADVVKNTYFVLDLLKTKYSIELALTLCAIEILFITKTKGKWYFIVIALCIHFLYVMNQRTKFERKVIWKNKDSYEELYTLLFCFPYGFVLISDLVIEYSIDFYMILLLVIIVIIKYNAIGLPRRKIKTKKN